MCQQTGFGAADFSLMLECSTHLPPQTAIRHLLQCSENMKWRKNGPGLPTTNTRYRTIFLHPSGSLSHRRHGCRGNHLLQTSCSKAVTEMGNSLQQGVLLVEVSSELLTYQVSHPSTKRCEILPRTCCTTSHLSRPHHC